jgi:hypothetical protein
MTMMQCMDDGGVVVVAKAFLLSHRFLLQEPMTIH